MSPGQDPKGYPDPEQGIKGFGRVDYDERAYPPVEPYEELDQFVGAKLSQG